MLWVCLEWLWPKEAFVVSGAWQLSKHAPTLSPAVVTCLSVRGLAFSLEVPISHTHTTVLVPPVITSLGLGQMAQRIWPHSDRHS